MHNLSHNECGRSWVGNGSLTYTHTHVPHTRTHTQTAKNSSSLRYRLSSRNSERHSTPDITHEVGHITLRIIRYTVAKKKIIVSDNRTPCMYVMKTRPHTPDRTPSPRHDSLSLLIRLQLKNTTDGYIKRITVSINIRFF